MLILSKNVQIKLLSVIVFACSIRTVKSQNYIDYYNIVNAAEYDIDRGQWKDAEKKLRQAFAIESPFPRDYYMLAKCRCARNKKNSAIRHLKKVTTDPFGMAVSKLSRDSIFFNKCITVKDRKRITPILLKLEKDFTNYRKVTEKYIKMKDTVSYFFNVDQQYRSLMKDNPCKDNKDTSEHCMNIRKEWSISDSLLQEKVYQYIINNGFPGDIGDDIYILLSHLQPAIYQKMKPVLIEELKKGKVDPFFLGMIFDRMEIQYNSNQCAYFVYGQDCSSDTWEKIIDNRLSIGMSIYYNGPRRGGYGPKNILPWVKHLQK